MKSRLIRTIQKNYLRLQKLANALGPPPKRFRFTPDQILSLVLDKAMLRLFKVYNADESDYELIFAKYHRQAASIAKIVWDENGYHCRNFKVVELCLPTSIKQGREPVGLVYEPATTPKEYRW
jgi:hypothetical protein